MLSCDDVYERLAESPPEDLPAADRAAVEAHTAACPDCATFLSAYGSVPDMVREALELEVDAALQAELDRAVMEALQKGA